MTNNEMKRKLASAMPDIPATFWDSRLFPESEDEIDAFVADVTADYNEITQDLSDKRVKQPPTEAELDKVMSNIMPGSYSRPAGEKRKPKNQRMTNCAIRL